MNKIIPSATLSFAIFLNAAAAFGGQWTEVPGAGPNPSSLYGVAVVSANDAWAVGAAGRRPLIEHWDGTSWSEAAAQPGGGQLYGIAARSSSDVWAVGQTNTEQTLVKHWNGLRWSTVSSPNADPYNTLFGVCIISHNDAWAVGFSVPYNYILMH